MTENLLPTLEELNCLPRWAIVAFAARCARRLQPSSGKVGTVDSGHHPITDAIFLAEQSAARAREKEVGKSILAAEALGRELFNEVSNLGDETDWAYLNSAPADAAAHAAASIQDSGRSHGHSALLVVRALHYVYERSPDVIYAARSDYELLKDATITENWNNDTPVPPEFFSLHSEFEEEAVLLFDNQIRDEIDAKLIEYFCRHPDQLYSLTPRQFEEVIAEMLFGFGFLVEVTQRTRDGGRDIIAVYNEPIGIKLLVECKRYAKNKTVGIAPVQRLHGVSRAEGATKGILVTTAPRFTQPAERFLKEQEWLLEGRAFGGLLDWLNTYQQFRMNKDRELLSPGQI